MLASSLLLAELGGFGATNATHSAGCMTFTMSAYHENFQLNWRSDDQGLAS